MAEAVGPEWDLMVNATGAVSAEGAIMRSEEYYRELQRRNVLRLILTYLAPMVLLSVYFYFQFRSLQRESLKSHLRAAAESYAGAMDLFLHERLMNLFNLMNDPGLRTPPSPAMMSEMLGRLQRASDTFEDIGFIDAAGVQVSYAGPTPGPAGRDYTGQAWLESLKGKSGNFVIADVHSGLRGKPQFTVAVSRVLDGRYWVLRAALDPARSYRFLSGLTEAAGVEVSIVNRAGEIQFPPMEAGAGSGHPRMIPVAATEAGPGTVLVEGKESLYACSSLRTCEWALIVLPSAQAERLRYGSARINIIGFSAAVSALILAVIYIRARKIVRNIRQADAARAHLTDNLMHASRLAAVGELASGIAHEINNPLAIINEEVGLIQDMSDPRFRCNVTLQDLTPHLDSIHDAVVRCRGITGKLLSFVRKDEIRVRPLDLHELIDGVVDHFYGRGVAGPGIRIVRSYCRDDVHVLADGTQLEQVFLNLINNAVDATAPGGLITITTTLLWEHDRVRVEVEDTGAGMTQEQLEKIFLPFFTTKQAGKGTGLGLSISYAIVKGLEGEMSVESEVGKGSTFAITLPFVKAPPAEASENFQGRGHDQQDQPSCRR